MNQEKEVKSISIYVNQEQIHYEFPVETCPGIYKIVFTNNSYYIGSASNVRARCMGHVSKLKNKKHENPIMQSVFLKYPQNIIFEVIKIVKKEDLLIDEQVHLNFNYGNKLCININPVANKPPSAKGRVHTAQHKTYMSEKMKGRVLTKEWKEKIGNSNKDPIILVRRRMKLYSKRCKEVVALQEQRNTLIEYFI